MLISGAGSNLQALLAAAESPLYPARIVAVGADVPAAGLAHADDYGVPSFVVNPRAFANREDWARVLLANLDFFQPDLLVLAGFMRILPPSVIEAYRGRIINVHPSLLPAFPGAHAVADALAAGAQVTGATVHFVDEGVDTGPVIEQRELAVLPDETATELHERIKVIERELLVQTVRALAEARSGVATADRRPANAGKAQD